MTYTEEDYLEDRRLLDDLTTRIDRAPKNAVPVFQGIVGLHDRVNRYEHKNGLATHQ